MKLYFPWNGWRRSVVAVGHLAGGDEARAGCPDAADPDVRRAPMVLTVAAGVGRAVLQDGRRVAADRADRLVQADEALAGRRAAA